MSTDANKELVRRQFDEFWNKADWSALDELFAPEYQNHDPYNPDQPTGPAGFRGRVEAYRTVLADFDLRVVSQIAEGDMVSTRWTLGGTHAGPIEGIEPTGTHILFGGQLTSHIVDGRFVEEWVHWDTLGALRQLGAFPAPT